MSKPHYILPTNVSRDSVAVRLGTGTVASGNALTINDGGKLVKAVAGQESAYTLTAIGEPIEGQITSIEQATSGGFRIGGINTEDRIFVTAEGSEAAGTGNLAVGDYVVSGTPVVKGTSLDASGANAYPKVRKATVQIGATPADLAAAGRQAALAAAGAWKVVSLVGSDGSPGSSIVIAPVGRKL